MENNSATWCIDVIANLAMSPTTAKRVTSLISGDRIVQTWSSASSAWVSSAIIVHFGRKAYPKALEQVASSFAPPVIFSQCVRVVGDWYECKLNHRTGMSPLANYEPMTFYVQIVNGKLSQITHIQPAEFKVSAQVVSLTPSRHKPAETSHLVPSELQCSHERTAIETPCDNGLGEEYRPHHRQT